MNLARELTKFPQGCLRADRASAFHATFASKTLEQSLQFECENAVHIIDAVSWYLNWTQQKNPHRWFGLSWFIQRFLSSLM